MKPSWVAKRIAWGLQKKAHRVCNKKFLGIAKEAPRGCKRKSLGIAKQSPQGLQRKPPKGCKLKSLGVTKKPLGIAKESLRFQMKLRGCKMKP